VVIEYKSNSREQNERVPTSAPDSRPSWYRGDLVLTVCARQAQAHYHDQPQSDHARTANKSSINVKSNLKRKIFTIKILHW
jgi:hypothetical protein